MEDEEPEEELSLEADEEAQDVLAEEVEQELTLEAVEDEEPEEELSLEADDEAQDVLAEEVERELTLEAVEDEEPEEELSLEADEEAQDVLAEEVEQELTLEDVEDEISEEELSIELDEELQKTNEDDLEFSFMDNMDSSVLEDVSTPNISEELEINEPEKEFSLSEDVDFTNVKDNELEEISDSSSDFDLVENADNESDAMDLSFVDDKEESDLQADTNLTEDQPKASDEVNLTFAEFAQELEGTENIENKESEELSENFESQELSDSEEKEESLNTNSGIDIQAAMEGFVNTLEPDDAIEKIVNNKLEEDQESEAELETEESSDIDSDEKPVEPTVSDSPLDAEIDELYSDDTDEPSFESESAPYKKTKKTSSKGFIGGVFVLVVALGLIGFTQKDMIMEKIQGSSSIDSVPNELAAPTDNSVTPKSKKSDVETETEAMLEDIEEPVQLLDTSVSITALTVDCDVPSNMVNTYSRRYFIKLAKRMQIEFKNALLISSEQPLANKIVVDLSVDKDIVKYEKISSSSGSKKVDNIAAKTAETILKNTQPYAGTFGANKGIVRLVVKF